MLYWAYGSNMSGRQMGARCPGAVAAGPALVRDVRLAFDRPSRRWGGHAADVLPAAGAETWGVLWRVTGGHLAALDRFEGVANGAYERTTVAVEIPGGEHVEAVTYRVCDPAAEAAPSARYLHVLLEGAREFGLPATYLTALQEHLRGA